MKRSITLLMLVLTSALLTACRGSDGGAETPAPAPPATVLPPPDERPAPKQPSEVLLPKDAEDEIQTRIEKIKDCQDSKCAIQKILIIEDVLNQKKLKTLTEENLLKNVRKLISIDET